MTTPTLIEAARAALDALGSLIDAQNGPPLIGQADEWECAMHEAHAAIDALRAAIEAAESAQPLTDDEIKRLAGTPAAIPGTFIHAIVRAVERHHRIGSEEGATT